MRQLSILKKVLLWIGIVVLFLLCYMPEVNQAFTVWQNTPKVHTITNHKQYNDTTYRWDTPVAGSGIEVEMLTDSTFSYRLIDMPGRMPSLRWPIGDTIPRRKIDTSKLPQFDTIAKNGLTKSDSIIKLYGKISTGAIAVGFTVVKPNGRQYTIRIPLTQDNKEENTYLEWPGGSRKCEGTRDMIRFMKDSMNFHSIDMCHYFTRFQ